jgi:hypothetical protein
MLFEMTVPVSGSRGGSGAQKVLLITKYAIMMRALMKKAQTQS